MTQVEDKGPLHMLLTQAFAYMEGRFDPPSSLAVMGGDDLARGPGLARALVGLSLDRAGALGLPDVSLQTRMELVKNHATFVALGLQMTGTTAHPGFDRPRSVSFCRAV